MRALILTAFNIQELNDAIQRECNDIEATGANILSITFAVAANDSGFRYFATITYE